MYIWWSERDKQRDIRVTKNTTVLESERHLKMRQYRLAPVAGTSFSHRLTAYKTVGHFFGLSYRNKLGHNQVENSFFRISNISVPCPHAQLRGRTVIKKLWTFFGPRGRDRSQSLPCWIFRVKQIHQSTASERLMRLTVGLQERLQKPRWRKIRDTLIYKQDGIILYFQWKGTDKKLIANGANLTFSRHHRGADE